MTILTISQAWSAGAFEIIIMLVVAFLLGLLLGYLIWNKKSETKEELGNNFESEYNSLKGKFSSLESANSKLKADLKACEDSKSNMSFASENVQKDELKKIEGIGPKIQELLYESGIYSFAQLANSESAKIKEILNSAGPRMQMHDPGSWPDQAKLAAEGKWDELKKWQDELKGGK